MVKLPSCTDRGPFDISDACVQSFWTAFAPALLTVFFTLVSLAPALSIAGIRDRFHDGLFRPYLTSEEAEAFLGPAESQNVNTDDIRPARPIHQWRLPLLIFMSFLQALAWIALAIFHSLSDEDDSAVAIFSAVTGITWLYNALKSLLCLRPTAHVELFILYATHFVFGVTHVAVLASHLQTASPSTVLEGMRSILNLTMVAAGLAMISTMPQKILPDDMLQELYDKHSPEDHASIFELVTYSWVYPLIKRGNTIEMKPEDVWNLTLSMQSRPIFTKFSTVEQPTLFRRLLVANSRDFILDLFLTTLTVLLSYAAPCLLYRILKLIENPTQDGSAEAYILALIAFVCALLKAEADTQHLHFGARVSARVNAQLMNTIYDKALKRRDCSSVTKGPESDAGPVAISANSNSPKPAADSGQVVNLMAIDVGKVSAAAASAYILYAGPLKITLACVTLYSFLGSAALAGFLVMFVAWMPHIFVARMQTHLQSSLSTVRDRRMSVFHELANIRRSIKLFFWEDHWIERVKNARGEEMYWLKRWRIGSSISALVWILSPLLVSSVSFLVYVSQGERLTPSLAFTTIALMDMLRQSVGIFADFTLRIFEPRVSLERIETFLNEAERSDCVSSPNKHDIVTDASDNGLAFDHCHFTWNDTSDQTMDLSLRQDGQEQKYFELRDVTVRFPEGKLSLVTGPTGCGKTALLLALLGEMTMSREKLVAPGVGSPTDRLPHSGAISYVAQTPWLRYGTIRENILFGYPYDRQRYEDVVQQCVLGPDLDSLVQGDQTLVGDSINLSAGQEARIALARAVYARTKYVLLDDPFSAIDAQTSRYLYDRLLCGPLLEGRTVILVTHHVRLVLPRASYIVRMLNGQISTQGYVRDFQASGRLPFVRHQLPREDPDSKINSRTSHQRDEAQTSHEPVSGGRVTFSNYKTYLQTASYWTCSVFIFLVVFSRSAWVGEKLWIWGWDYAYGNGPKVSLLDNTHPGTLPFILDTNEHPLFYVMIYAVIGSVAVLCSIASSVTLYMATLEVSRSLFDRPLGSVVRANLPWPQRGRILNTLSKDMHAIDVNLSSCLNTVVNAFVNIVATIITIMVFCPAFVVPATIITFWYRFVVKRYLNVRRQLLRMESASQSSIICALGELLDGIVTIRAFQCQHRFMDEFHQKIDVANKMYYNSMVTNKWLLFHHGLLGSFAVFMTTLLVLFQDMGPGTAGLCITSAMLFTTSMYLVCRFGASLESDLNAVERVAECSDSLEDHSATIESKRPPIYWPFRSSTPLLSVEGLSVKYGPKSPLVLNNVSFTLNRPERVGIIGRTGSGRSTLINSLLRLISPVEGRIVIDGIDIATISCRDLRSRMAHVPECIELVSGTLRDNIDPFGEHEEKDCMDALRRVQLLGDGGQVRDSSSGSWQGGCEASPRTTITLDTLVAPKGANFSLGQRRLIAIAGALLKRNPIIILYEATSGTDPDTDTKIHEILCEQFKHSLLITVVNRMSSIIGYDRLIVLQDGRIVEFDTPINLINKEGGVFREMCYSSESHAELEAAVLARMIRDR